MKKDWTNLRATLEQISTLQPHSIAVWRYQAWNLSYNVSVAFDDYPREVLLGHRGHQVHAEGRELQRARAAALLGRRLVHLATRSAGPTRPSSSAACSGRTTTSTAIAHAGTRDNWLVGKGWFKDRRDGGRRAAPDHQHVGSDLLLRRPHVPVLLRRALEKEGHFDEVAQAAWKEAAREWRDYGEKLMPTGYDVPLRLNDQEKLEEPAKRNGEAIDKPEPRASARR